MAQALAEGFLRTKALRPEQMSACARNWEKLRANTEPRGIRPCRNAQETVQSSDQSLPVLEIKNIKSPREIKELIHQTVEEMKLSRRMRVGEILGDTPEDSQDEWYYDENYGDNF